MGNRQGFGSSTTAEQAAEKVDLSGKVIIITGCNTGIGKETARVLAMHGGTIVMACRDTTKAQQSKDDIVKNIPTTSSEEKKEEVPYNNANVAERIEIMPLDLGSLKSVHEFATQFANKYDQLHFLVNNAGIMALPQYQSSTDGYEMQFATNHLGHYYLTRLLIPTMLNTKGMSRIVQVSSSAHNRAPNPLSPIIDDLVTRQDGPAKDDYGAWRNYGISKACNILFARHINTLYSKEENGIRGVSLHPGVIPTELSRNMSGGQQWVLKHLGRLIKSIPQGAATTVRCVSLTDEQLDGGGKYYSDCNAHDQVRADMRLGKTEKDNIDTKLWEISEKLISSKGFSMTLENNTVEKTEEKDNN